MVFQDDSILVISNDAWDTPKRVRHKMPLTWAREGNRVLWMEKPPFPPEYRDPPGRLRRALKGELRQVTERLWVGSPPPAIPTQHRGGWLGNTARALHRPFFVRRIRHFLHDLGLDPDWLVLFGQAERWDLLSDVPHRWSIYYCHDLFERGRAPAQAVREEERCCRRVDVVFTTSEHLRQRLVRWNPRTYAIPHAVDLDWWGRNWERTPPEYAGIRRPRLVYTGVIDPKMDLGLVDRVASLRPEWQVVFVGPATAEMSGNRDLAKVGKDANVHLLGSRPVEALPGFLAGADILILPYGRGAMQEAIGLPLKFYEYLISGKPVLATPFTEFETEHRDLIHVAGDAHAWVDAVERLLVSPEPDGIAESRRAVAKKNTYEARVAAQRKRLAELVGDEPAVIPDGRGGGSA
jgi:glycosyltransferase involved in cell wall biosynthesis